jgi:cellulose synthase/poly-beta-1,6-N-acetylglucosamine synthase-like glycosyltransferase
MIPIAVDVALALAALPALLASGYLLLLTLASARRPPPAAGAPRLRFDLVVPAHDEEAGIAATVASLRALDWPAPLRRVLVVADNCRDATAARAREAGAEVLVRDDPGRRGKGYALALAFERALADGRADAVVVVDADTSASPGLLAAFAARLEAGALAVQARYGVRNPEASWRTGLMAIALALFHDVRSLGRERLGLSAGLRGNGMCFAARALREVPHRAFSIVEDLEHGVALGLAGHRVWYAGEAEVLGDMAAGEAASRTQRRRWEGGRRELRRTRALPLLRRALAERDPVLLDLFLDLVVPPLGALAAATAAGLLAAALASRWAGRPLAALWPWALCAAALGLHVLRGWWLSGTGLRGLGLLARAPAYLAWKAGLALGRRAGTPRAWERTPRERP